MIDISDVCANHVFLATEVMSDFLLFYYSHYSGSMKMQKPLKHLLFRLGCNNKVDRQLLLRPVRRKEYNKPYISTGESISTEAVFLPKF